MSEGETLASSTRRLADLLASIRTQPAPNLGEVKEVLDAIEEALSARRGSPDVAFVLGAVADARVALRPENHDLLPSRLDRSARQLSSRLS
jgi:hypothetical protein